jgi:hypothetical protein
MGEEVSMCAPLNSQHCALGTYLFFLVLAVEEFPSSVVPAMSRQRLASHWGREGRCSLGQVVWPPLVPGLAPLTLLCRQVPLLTATRIY